MTLKGALGWGGLTRESALIRNLASGLLSSLPLQRLISSERLWRLAIMGFMAYAKDVFILTSILSLFLLGLTLSLKSGVVAVGRDRGRQLWTNASGLIIALAGYVTLLLMLQQMVGIPISSCW
jgi:hypothetical protein